LASSGSAPTVTVNALMVKLMEMWWLSVAGFGDIVQEPVFRATQ
jgi:hypothetical protein